MFHIIIYCTFACFAASSVLESRFVAEVDIPDLVLRLDANEAKLTTLTKDFNDLKAKYNHPPVAFKAHLTSSSNPGLNQRIIFDDVQLNLGNAYFQHLGGFLAPLNGTYLFSVSVCSHGGHFILLDLMKNTNRIGGILAGDSLYDDCSSETTVTQLNAGDQVYVQHHESSGDLIFAHQNIINSFTGVLLQIS
ncbi:heavy metal-binding protein HIP-like [Dreissena polymorpha]|uniref:C1q domain-containing protein n=1 Tax=Dreissena polymorpha TaxID=45954 RepID=A0A9D4EXN4_DREPO|nr:heavy metal-binding protein HIP-like [Dreissena polymorpha]KAH3785880.1 hypothetical protein DPMN_163975 [Dreissena polymorpha]